jgi:glycerol kinase
MHETTALGAAIAAGFAIDIWTTFDELKHMNRANRTTFEPVLSPQESAKMNKQWSKAVQMCRGWLDTSEIDSESTPDD